MAVFDKRCKKSKRQTFCNGGGGQWKLKRRFIIISFFTNSFQEETFHLNFSEFALDNSK